VAVGVVGRDSLAEPHHAPRAEPAREPLLHLRARARRRLAIRIQQARLSSQDRSRTVAVDRAALEHKAGLVARHARERRDGRADAVVEIPRRILPAPRVEPECERAPVARAVRDEERPGVAQPRVVGGDVVEAHADFGIHTRGDELLARRLLARGVADQQLHHLAPLQRAHDLRVLGLRLGQVPRPRRGRVRPREPDRAVGFPFGGPAPLAQSRIRLVISA
jgi:hypothetical protein